ncbi:hypothetical protein Xcc3_31920 [Xanthomonas campestris pv. campestris]|nr:hypothetical protein Xcc1_30960 [Xanthomonas campestris pv. campestris]BBK01885.1 hypothetical protein Xcc3_31920 [Xanthomonas campestris pv. campestris]
MAADNTTASTMASTTARKVSWRGCASWRIGHSPEAKNPHHASACSGFRPAAARRDSVRSVADGRWTRRASDLLTGCNMTGRFAPVNTDAFSKDGVAPGLTMLRTESM